MWLHLHVETVVVTLCNSTSLTQPQSGEQLVDQSVQRSMRGITSKPCKASTVLAEEQMSCITSATLMHSSLRDRSP